MYTFEILFFDKKGGYNQCLAEAPSLLDAVTWFVRQDRGCIYQVSCRDEAKLEKDYFSSLEDWKQSKASMRVGDLVYFMEL